MIASYLAAERVDVFVPFVNCMVFPTGNMPPEVRIRRAVAFVSRISQTFRVPIIGLSGVPTCEQLIRAGADYYFDVPFRPREFVAAFESCLEISSDPELHQRGQGVNFFTSN